jgi:hypothetical protein
MPMPIPDWASRYDIERHAYQCIECGKLVPAEAIDGGILRHKCEKKLEIVETKSGAKSSKAPIRYDLVPATFLKRTAKRYTLGLEYYSEYNWRKGIQDVDFVQSRINHIIAHLQDYIMGENLEDDNLAAVAWGVSMLMEFEENKAGLETINQVRNRMVNFKGGEKK